MTKASILREAEEELWETVAYYEKQSPGLGLDFEAEVGRALRSICSFPERCPLREDGTRRYLMQRFPYLVIYAYLDGHVWAIAFAHCRRKPEYWHDRVERAKPRSPSQ